MSLVGWEELKSVYCYTSTKLDTEYNKNNPLFGQTLTKQDVKEITDIVENLKKPDKFLLGMELGSWIGYSANLFMRYCDNLICADIWHDFSTSKASVKPQFVNKDNVLFNSFCANTWEFRDSIIPLRNHSVAALYEVYIAGLKPDFIFVDADHSYFGCYSDIKAALKLFPDSLIFGHDYYSKKGVKVSVDELAELNNKKVIISDKVKNPKKTYRGVWVYADKEG